MKERRELLILELARFKVVLTYSLSVLGSADEESLILVKFIRKPKDQNSACLPR